MTIDYIKKEIPQEISPEGGAQVYLVNRQTVPLDTSIREAKDADYAMGSETLIKGFFQGLFQSAIAGIERDGHARQIGNCLTLYPVAQGPIDLEKGWDPAVNSIYIRARLLKDLKLDTSKWTFRDVTPGRRAFKVANVTTGDLTGVVQNGLTVHLNGAELPPTSALRVHWACGDKSGDVASAALTSDATRIDVAASALAALASSTYDGQEIAFTVRGCYTKAVVSGVYRYVAPQPTFTSVRTEGQTAGQARANAQWLLEGTLLDRYDTTAGDSVTCYYKNEGVETSFDMSQMAETTAACLKPEARLTSCDVGSEGRVVAKVGGVTLTKSFTIVA